jgi:preprotein translocase subunit SecY
MLKTFINAFKVEEIRKKMFYTFVMLVVVRLGSQIPIPGVDPEFISDFFGQVTGGAFNFFNAFTGGSFEQMSIFALSISPYITSSIIVQLLTIAIPRLEEIQHDGEEGKKKIAAITRYVTVILAVLQAAAMSIGFGNQGLLKEYNFVNVMIVIVTMTAGSAFLMWAGERITEKGIGNGISMILLINILSSLPNDFVNLYTLFMKENITNKKFVMAGVAALIIILVILAVIVFTVLLQGGERRIAVQYSQKIHGRKTVGGQSSHIPLKVNTACVIPVIFASSLMQFPILIATFAGANVESGKGLGIEILNGLNSNNWFNPESFRYTWGLIVYIVLTIAFAYFYTSITFNPMEIANNMKKSGGFVPGIRPGKPTVDYLAKILKYIIFVGAVGLVIVQVIPFFFNGFFGAMVSFGGTSLIIIVGVVLETIQQIESQMLVRNYKGFLNSGK